MFFDRDGFIAFFDQQNPTEEHNFTPWKFNIAPKDIPSHKERKTSNHHLSGALCEKLQECRGCRHPATICEAQHHPSDTQHNPLLFRLSFGGLIIVYLHILHQDHEVGWPESSFNYDF